jgi:DHA2 family multidrug resistance protein-like MFS transporter
MIDVRLFGIRAFSASLGTYLLGIFVVVGYFLFISQYLQLVLGLTPLVAAFWSLPSAVGFVVGSTIAPRIIHRFRPSLVMGTGMAVSAVGTAILIGLSVDGGLGSLLLITAASVVISLGLAPVITLATELIVGSAPPEQAGAATGMSETGGELGGALGIAILGSIGTAVYRTEVADMLPSGVPAAAADAARDTLGGALEIAETLPDAVRTALVAAAQTAFVDALHLVAAVAAAGAVVTAIVAAVALRGVAARSEPAPEEGTAEPIVATD